MLASRLKPADVRWALLIAAGEAMNAIASLHWSLASPRCGLIQSEMLPYVAWGQKCWMSPLHSEKIHAAFDNLDEQPTESRSYAPLCTHECVPRRAQYPRTWT